MLDAAELNFLGRYNGGQISPIGTYLNFRTLAYYQSTTDSTLPQAGTWILISTNATLTAAQIATTVNNGLSTSYTAGSFHAYTSADNISTPGQMSDDA